MATNTVNLKVLPASELDSADRVTEQVSAEIVSCFEYKPWSPDQVYRGSVVRSALIEAVRVIIQTVPPSADRSAAIRKIREARMDCNSAITHEGKY